MIYCSDRRVYRRGYEETFGLVLTDNEVRFDDTEDGARGVYTAG